MPKRKASDSEGGASPSASSDADPQPSVSKNKATSGKQSQKTPSSYVSKRSKTDGSGSSSAATDQKVGSSSKIQIHTNAEGDKYIDLGKKRRAVVRSFKGTPLVDIREYYSTDGQEKPGKKGISLTFEQWEILRNSSSTIDELFADKKTMS